ncbi:MAG TPA: Ig-like domain-containing protein, partial [Pirellula sp.]|nr:Ig-like domain-containing protein [Pirellula sp.]
IESAILASPLQLSPSLIGADTVHLGLSPSGKALTLTSGLVIVGVSRSISDGQSFSITFGSITKTFEFTSDSTVTAGNIAIPLLPTDTQETLAVRTAGIIQAAGLGLTPFHVRDGNISIGGTSQHSISVLNAPSIGLFGTPGVAPTTTIAIIGSLVLQVPSRGGIDLRDDTTFSITANNITVVFEFDRNFSGPTLPGNVVIPYRFTNTADEIATSMVTAINAAGLNIISRFIGSGRVDLGLLADNQVDVLDSRLISQRGNVGAGEYFSIGNGLKTVVFEFVNVSSGGTATAGRVPILFSNASTRDQVIAAMKAAIEGAGLGLTNSVVGPASLRLLDTPKFVYDFRTAPSLSKSGVSGGATPIQFLQDVSFTSDQVAKAIVRALNAAVNTSIRSKIRGNNTLFVENAISISPQIPNFYLRAVEDLAGNNLKPNRVNNETQFTIFMPGVTLDFGDAPDPFSTTRGRYATLQENDGARHTFSGGTLRLGSQLDTEINGQPTPGANGDGADDDGVSFVSISNPTGIFNRNIFTDITVTASEPGFVDGWIDFNSDGDWDDPGERILNAVEFTAGALTQTFKVTVPVTTPASNVANNSYARFRISSVGGLEPSGIAVGGEVEDYFVTIVPGSPPTAINDSYQISEDAVPGLITNDPTGTITPNFRIDDGVAANDTDADGGTFTTRLVVGPQNAAFFDLRPDGTFTYRPIPNFFGTDTFTYVVSDGVLTSTNVGTVTIVVREVNDAPVGGDDALTINEDATQVLPEASLLANDSPGNAFEVAQTLRITRVSAVSTKGGSVSLLNGVVTYVPPTDFVGLD